MTTYGTAADFLGAEVVTEEVTVRGKPYIVREAALVKRENGTLVPNMNGRALARLVVMSVVDEQGKRLFKDTQVEEVAALPASILTRISDVTKRLSGITSEDIEELAGNSEGDQSDSSSSASPSLSVAPSPSSSTPSRAAN
jgi:hypothetical protein